MRIGLYGGSFNPITNAHLTILENAKHELKLDKMLVVPANTPYFKDQSTIAPASDRLQMARLTTFGEFNVEVSDVEIVRGGNSYTIDTINWLREQEPYAEIYLILGSDALKDIEKWKNFKEIFEKSVIITFARDDQDATWHQIFYLMREYDANIVLLDSYIPNISSTLVRQAIQKGESFKYLVPDSVRNYIADHQLYNYRRELYD